MFPKFEDGNVFEIKWTWNDIEGLMWYIKQWSIWTYVLFFFFFFIYAVHSINVDFIDFTMKLEVSRGILFRFIIIIIIRIYRPTVCMCSVRVCMRIRFYIIVIQHIRTQVMRTWAWFFILFTFISMT